jgi:hypothetical protein
VSTETKWTPGPWDARTGTSWSPDGGSQTIEWFVMRPREDVAICADVVDPNSEKPSEANARLIAAAPDLYAALDKLSNTSAMFEPVEYQQARQNARAALAKARGETP